MIPAVYLKSDGETWEDAGDYSLALSPKFATLTRTRKPESYLPGAIEQASKLKMVRENWDKGKRRMYPSCAGIPLVFLAAGATDYKAPVSVMGAEDIKAMF